LFRLLQLGGEGLPESWDGEKLEGKKDAKAGIKGLFQGR